MSDSKKGLAIVTGASSGIGAEIARQLSARGHPILAVARRAERLEQMAADAIKTPRAPVHALALDVTAPGAALALRDRARALGGASILVNNAGVFRLGAVADSDPAQQAALVRLNCEAVVAICAAVVPDLVARGAGVVLNVASLAGMQPTPFYAAYGASKAFVVSYSEALREELRGTGVSVTALCPGPVTTELVEAAGIAESERQPPSYELSAEEVARAGIEGAQRGDAIVIPGLWNKAQAIGSRLAPRALVRRVSRATALSYLGFAKAKAPKRD